MDRLKLQKFLLEYLENEFIDQIATENWIDILNTEFIGRALGTYSDKIEEINVDSLSDLREASTLAYNVLCDIFNLNPENLVIPSGTKRICDYCCYGVDSIKNLILPEGLEEIAPSAFKYTKLKTISFPSSLVTINTSAFSDIDSTIESLEFNSSILILDWHTFRNSKCKQVTFNVSSKLVIDPYCFFSSGITTLAFKKIPKNWSIDSVSAFKDCVNFKRVIIGDCVFDFNKGGISFNGTLEDFKKVNDQMLLFLENILKGVIYQNIIYIDNRTYMLRGGIIIDFQTGEELWGEEEVDL